MQSSLTIKGFYTKIENNFLDSFLEKLSGAAVKIYLVISRKTVGWQKESDVISISQIQKQSGLSVNSVLHGIKELKTIDLIEFKKEGRGKATRITYRIKPAGKQKTNTAKSEVLKPDFISENEPKGESIIAKSENTKDNNLKILEKEKGNTEKTKSFLESENTSRSAASDMDIVTETLLDNGLSSVQVEKVIHTYDIEYLKVKLEQMEYLLKNKPFKIKGKGKFLWNSIIQNWQFDEYYDHINRQERERVRKEEKDKAKIISESDENLKQENETYQDIECQEFYDSLPISERVRIDDEIKALINQSPFRKLPGVYETIEKIKRRSVIVHRMQETDMQKTG